MSHTCQFPFVVKGLMQLSLTTPGPNARRFQTAWNIYWERITIIITCFWRDAPSHCGLLCFSQIIGFWKQATEPTVTLCWRLEAVSSQWICRAAWQGLIHVYPWLLCSYVARTTSKPTVFFFLPDPILRADVASVLKFWTRSPHFH